MEYAVHFREVHMGERFRVLYKRRFLGAVRVENTLVQNNQGNYMGNAVVLTDHMNQPVSDLGAIIHIYDTTGVIVYRA